MRIESRNTNVGIQGELLPLPDQAPQIAGHRARSRSRVGGRHPGARPAGMGGGSPGSCNAPKSGVPALRAGGAPPRVGGRDPRVEELRRMGLRATWIAVADTIGFDAFIQVWQTISANKDYLDGRNRITIPGIETYLRFQRNNLIRTLAATGASAGAICESLKHDHKMDVELAAVRWVMRKMRE